MACASGVHHTVTLSDDGTIHSFGKNMEGQLGLGHNKNVALPSRIPNLSKIREISCGNCFTICIDYKGFMWSFGQNNNGQLGTGNTTNFNVPQKIQEIPPVQSVSCGYDHTLIITIDSNLWSCGNNCHGQLCLGNRINQEKPQKTLFSNIIKISTGYYHSIFQNNKKKLFGCGHNLNGELGLGHCSHPQITVALIPYIPSNIIEFVCGHCQSLFLDSEGNVYSVGFNSFGSLGLGHNTNQNIFYKIQNIPPIQTISCVYASCYLIDFKGNIWSFGYNKFGQLGHGDTKNINLPKIITSVKDIKMASYGSFGEHFFIKNSENKIFALGNNNYGQLGTGDLQSVLLPKEMNSQYFTIWGNNQQNFINQWINSAEIMNWNDEERKKIEMIQSKIKEVKNNLKLNNNDKSKQEFPRNSFESWHDVYEFLNEKFHQMNLKLNQKQNIKIQPQKDVQIYENELKEIENQLQKLQKRKKEIEENLLPKAKKNQNSFEETFKEIENNQKALKEMCSDVSIFCKNENEMNVEISTLFNEKTFEEFDCFDISKVLWKMDLTKYQSHFELNQINGVVVSAIDDVSIWEQLGLEKRDCFSALYYFNMMKCAGYSQTFSPDYDHDCCVCSHNTPEKTIHLLKEYEIPIEDDFILKNNYTAPMLISKTLLKDLLGKDFFSQKGIQILLTLDIWKKIHDDHLKNLKDKI